LRVSRLVIFSLLLGHQVAFSQSIDCTPNQLDIRQIAGDAPGMSKSNAFFAILNVGKKPCKLSAQLVRVGEEALRVSFHDNTPVDFVLPPVREKRFIRAKDVIGFNVSNDSASGPTRHIGALHFEFQNGDSFTADYAGYDTAPFSPQAQIIPFFAWQVFQGDQCLTPQGKALSFVENPEIDTRKRLSCG
jgi:hypothetical protein